ncbi:SDR family oxidoreductase [Pendulispora rubella]|uniref:SDR family oxidoreductase n=1 Tax=Pendulispora rubella TaxID=2741070 RepID=A0ABZ2L6F2_9BACT
MAYGSLVGTTIVILGAGKMGRAIAAAAAGARIVFLGRGEATLESARAALPGVDLRTIVADATDEADVAKAFEAIGPVDHIVAATSSGTAGVAPPEATIPRVNLADAHAVYRRLWAAYNALHVGARVLRPGGSVTLISGASARRPTAGFGIYGALHAAIEGLARAAAVELAPLRVNVVSPGSIGVNPMRQLTHHHGRFDDLADAVLSVIRNPAVTSAVFDVDGGESLGTWSGE